MAKHKTTPTIKTISSVAELYGGGMTGNLLRPEFATDKQVYAWLQRRHGKVNRFLDEGVYHRNGHTWKVPYGVRSALRASLTSSQLSTRYPFQVTWRSPKTGKRLYRQVESLTHAIIFIAEKAQYVDPHASIIARHGFYIPTKLMGHFPRPMLDRTLTTPRKRMHYWCPRCMAPRVFRRCGDQTFMGPRKVWVVPEPRKGVPHYEWIERKLALTECTICRLHNRDHKFRACNQPLEKKRIKQGKTRVRRKR